MIVNADMHTLLTFQGYVRANLRVSKHWLIGNVDVDTKKFKWQWISSLVPQCLVSHWRKCDLSRIETIMWMTDNGGL